MLDTNVAMFCSLCVVCSGLEVSDKAGVGSLPSAPACYVLDQVQISEAW